MNSPFRLFLVTLVFLQGSASPLPAEQIQENWKPYVISTTDPVIPAVALRQGWGGRVVCILTINPKNGIVDEVKVVRQTRYPRLNAETVLALFKWRFRPGTISQTQVTYDIGVYGRGHDYHTGGH
jgi:TonB family protein